MDGKPSAGGGFFGRGKGSAYASAATYSLFRRLKRLVRTLIGAHYASLQDIWQLQVDLLSLQRDIQEQIGATKKQVKREKDAQFDLQSLRHLRRQARRFGDAVAWAILGNDRQLIYPLSENAPVAVGAEDHGARGALAIAEVLGSSGWGFPIIHDITDCLRIGDITFVKVAIPESTDSGTAATRDRQIQTVEVKTNLIEETPTDDGRTSYNYRVTLISAFDISANGDVIPKAPDVTGPPIPLQRKVAPRVERQLKRMDTARVRQEAVPDTVTTIGDEFFISAAVSSGQPGHWRTLRRVIRNARKNGYASEAVEKAFLYTAFYRLDGVDEEAIKDQRLVTDLRNSGILFEDPHEDNSIIIDSIPTRESSRPDLFLPYFLYPLPQRAIFDLLYGRLVIVVLMNRGRIAEALERAGFDVVTSPGRDDPFESFVAWGRVMDEKGIEYRVSVHNLHMHVREMVYEFKGTQYLVDTASKMRDVALVGFRFKEESQLDLDGASVDRRDERR